MASGALYHFLMAEAASVVAENEPEQNLSDDILGYIFESLPIRSLGAVSSVSRQWREAHNIASVWQRSAEQQGYTWGQSTPEAERNARQSGGWKAYVKREHELARHWLQPNGRQLRPHVLDAGHHWVPTILMDEATRELVTCSYDGTVRFWTSPNAKRPSCFKVLTAGNAAEGFSCIHMLAQGADAPVLLAAGSELGNVHVWEAWRPEDREESEAAARWAAAERAVAAERPSGRTGGSGAEGDGGGGPSSLASHTSGTSSSLAWSAAGLLAHVQQAAEAAANHQSHAQAVAATAFHAAVAASNLTTAASSASSPAQNAQQLLHNSASEDEDEDNHEGDEDGAASGEGEGESEGGGSFGGGDPAGLMPPHFPPPPPGGWFGALVAADPPNGLLLHAAAVDAEANGVGVADISDLRERLLFRRPRFSRKLTCWSGAHDFVQSILVLPGGVVCSGGDSGSVRVHRLPPSLLAAGGGGGTAASLLLPSSGAGLTLEGHSGAVMCLDAPRLEASPPSASSRGLATIGTAQPYAPPSVLFSGSVDHSVGVWDLAAGGRRVLRLDGHSRSVHCLTLGSACSGGGGATLFTGSRDHSIKLWDLRSHTCEHTLLGHTGSVTCIGVHGWRLLSGGGYNRGADDDEVLSVDSSLKLWDLRMLGGGRGSSASSSRGLPSSSFRGGGTPRRSVRRGSYHLLVSARQGAIAPHASSALVWSREAPSPPEPSAGGGGGAGSGGGGDPVLSLQLLEDRVLTSHGGKSWTARIWDLCGGQCEEEQSEEEEDDEDEGGRRRAVSLG